RYGRLVGDVLLPDGRNLGQELVRAGLAWWYRQYAPPKETALVQLEAEARTAKRTHRSPQLCAHQRFNIVIVRPVGQESDPQGQHRGRPAGMYRGAARPALLLDADSNLPVGFSKKGGVGVGESMLQQLRSLYAAQKQD